MENNKTNVEYMLRKVNSLMKEKRETDNKRAKKIAKGLLADNLLTLEQRITITSALMTIEIRLKNYEEAIILGESLEKVEMLPDIKRSVQQKLEYVRNLINMKNDKSKPLKDDNKRTIDSLRSDLYEGRIEPSTLKELAEEYIKTAKGCIFIAELCKYFNLEQQGIKCLKGYRRNNLTTIKRSEQKAMNIADDLLRQNTIRLPKEKWSKVYDELEKTTVFKQLENNS